MKLLKIDWDKYEYFKQNEFLCPCCQKEEMNEATIDMLEKAREIAGVPFSINSGFRCERRNEAVGGVKNSSHTVGFAVDIRCHDNKRRFLIVEALQKVGFTRIIIYPSFIHTDNLREKKILLLGE